MRSFFDDQNLKIKATDILNQHIKNDDLIKSEYWNGEKGTAVGCTVESFDCNKFETELGIPKDLAFLEDAIFNEIPLEQGSSFALDFLNAIEVGSNLSSVYAKLIVWQFEDLKHGLGSIRNVKNESVLYTFCEEVIALYKKEIEGLVVPAKEFEVLYTKITKAWAIEGEKRRVERMMFARKWCFLGARKWAWIPIKSWSCSWAWLMSITRPRSRSQAISIIINWSKAWKWLRFYRSHNNRINILSKQFLGIIRDIT